MRQDPSLLRFTFAFREHWFAAMSGGASVPFTILAIYLDNKWAQAVFFACGLTCAWFAAYRLWKSEREKVVALREKLEGLKLIVEFDPDGIPGCRRYFEDAWRTHFRMKITNPNKQTIHKCRGKVSSVERLETQGYTLIYSENVPLTWSLLIDVHETDLQSGEALFLNVIEMGYEGGGALPLSARSSARFIAMSNANNPPHKIDIIGKYRCTVIITSNNTAAINAKFIFDWYGEDKAMIANVAIS